MRSLKLIYPAPSFYDDVVSKKQSHPAFEALAATLQARHPGLEPGSLFGMPCLKYGKVWPDLAGEAIEDA